MYEILIDRLSQNGFEQYEIANFARVTDQAAKGIPGYACRHNVNYWVGGEYLALGPAAAGHLDGPRYQNWSNTDLSCEAVKAGREEGLLSAFSPLGRERLCAWDVARRSLVLRFVIFRRVVPRLANRVRGVSGGMILFVEERILRGRHLA